MREYFPEPKPLVKVKGELEFPNYAIKIDFRNTTGIDTSCFTKKVDLACLSFNVDKLDIAKLKDWR